MKNIKQVAEALQTSEDIPRTKKVGKVIAGAALSASMGVGVIASTANAETKATSEVTLITQALNSHEGVAQNVTTAHGFELPFSSESIKGAVAIVNPIVIGKDRYGYVSPDAKVGHVKIEEFSYDGPLEITPGYDAETAYIETSSIGVVFQDLGQHKDGPSNRYTWVTLGDRSGNVDKFLRYEQDAGQTIRNMGEEEQLAQIVENSVGELDYEGK